MVTNQSKNWEMPKLIKDWQELIQHNKPNQTTNIKATSINYSESRLPRTLIQGLVTHNLQQTKIHKPNTHNTN